MMKKSNNKMPLASELIKDVKNKLNLFKVFTIISGIVIFVLLIILFIKA